MYKNNRGFTLIEMLLVLGLAASATMMGVQTKMRDATEQTAFAAAGEINTYIKAVRRYRHTETLKAFDGGVQTGYDWLKDTTCATPGLFGPGAAIPEYQIDAFLPCNFATNKLVPNVTTTLTTTNKAKLEFDPVLLNGDMRVDLSGIITRRIKGAMESGDTPDVMEFADNDVNTAKITLDIDVSNAGYLSTLFVRRDGTAPPTADMPWSGHSLLDVNEVQASVFIDREDSTFSLDMDETSTLNNLVAHGDISSNNEVLGKLFKDLDDNNFYVNPNGTSQLHELNVSTLLTVEGALNVDGDITTKAAAIAKIFVDKDNASYYVDPASTSVVNKLVTTGGTEGWNSSYSFIGKNASGVENAAKGVEAGSINVNDIKLRSQDGKFLSEVLDNMAGAKGTATLSSAGTTLYKSGIVSSAKKISNRFYVYFSEAIPANTPLDISLVSPGGRVIDVFDLKYHGTSISFRTIVVTNCNSNCVFYDSLFAKAFVTIN